MNGNKAFVVALVVLAIGAGAFFFGLITHNPEAVTGGLGFIMLVAGYYIRDKQDK